MARKYFNAYSSHFIATLWSFNAFPLLFNDTLSPLRIHITPYRFSIDAFPLPFNAYSSHTHCPLTHHTLMPLHGHLRPLRRTTWLMAHLPPSLTPPNWPLTIYRRLLRPPYWWLSVALYCYTSFSPSNTSAARMSLSDASCVSNSSARNCWSCALFCFTDKNVGNLLTCEHLVSEF